MKSIAGLLSLLLVFQGCSIYKAATAPPSVPVGDARIGSTRAEVLSVFGMPKSTEVEAGGRIDMYEFTDGNPGASKLRIIPYIAADLFTLSLAELVLWPLELTALQGSDGRAIVTYDTRDIATAVKVTKKNGEPWHYGDIRSPAPPQQEARR
jgi:hypothetical protein